MSGSLNIYLVTYFLKVLEDQELAGGKACLHNLYIKKKKKKKTDSWRSHKCLHQGTLIFAKSPKRHEVGRLRKCFLTDIDWIKCITLKLRIMLYSVMLLRTIAQESASWLALRNCSKEKREEPGYMGVFCWKADKQKPCIKHQKITADHKKEKTSQVNDFDAFTKFSGIHASAKTFFSKIFPLSPSEILIQCVLLMSRN